MDAVSTNTRENRWETAKLGPYASSNSVTSTTVCAAIDGHLYDDDLSAMAAAMDELFLA